MADGRPDPRSGLDEHGEWRPAFEGQRPPFEPGNELRFPPGNDLALKHGAFATLKLGPRADEIAAEVRELVPAYRPNDEVSVYLLALALARIEAAWAAVSGAKAGESESLETRLRQWVNSAARLADKLGMTPTSRGRLGLDVALTRRVLTLSDLHAAAADERPPEVEGEVAE